MEIIKSEDREKRLEKTVNRLSGTCGEYKKIERVIEVSKGEERVGVENI